MPNLPDAKTLLLELAVAYLVIVAIVGVIAHWLDHSPAGRATGFAVRGAYIALRALLRGLIVAATLPIVVIVAYRTRQPVVASTLANVRARSEWAKAATHADPKLETLGTGRPLAFRGVRITPGGFVKTIRLRRGVTWSQLDAAKLGAYYRGLPGTTLVTPGRSENEARVRIVYRDVLAAPIDPPAYDSLEAWRPVVPLGVNEDLEPIRLVLEVGHAMLAGATGSGKTTILQTVIGHFVRGDAALWLFDGKGGTSMKRWASVATRIHDEDGGDRIEAALAMLDDLRLEVEQRNRVLKARDAERWGELADPFPPLLVVVDELPSYVANAGKPFVKALADVMWTARSTRVYVVLAFQRGTSDTVPSALTSLVETRIALKCATPEMSAVILDHTWAPLAVALPDLAVGAVDGVSPNAGRFVFATSAGVVRGRAYRAAAPPSRPQADATSGAASSDAYRVGDPVVSREEQHAAERRALPPAPEAEPARPRARKRARPSAPPAPAGDATAPRAAPAASPPGSREERRRYNREKHAAAQAAKRRRTT